MWKTHKRTIVLTGIRSPFHMRKIPEIYTVQAANSHGFAACFRFFPVNLPIFCGNPHFLLTSFPYTCYNKFCMKIFALIAKIT